MAPDNSNKQVNNADTKCTRHIDCSSQKKGYCDGNTLTCKPCQMNCIVCESTASCNSCEPATHVTTITGECTPICPGLQYRQFCENGKPKACTEGATSPCKCGVSSNCGTCTGDVMPTCATCLKGMKMDDNDRCMDCAVGYRKFVGRCWPIVPEPDIPIAPVDPEVPVVPIVPVVPVDPEAPASNKLGGGAVTGIVIGVILVVGAVAGGLAYYFIKRGKK
ncbi:Cysteine-rich membrane protein 1 [Spironucleus salmonicida]|uniref:Cysteine-rich membrane protein 1 n=1 Tax=Spironucleus salmonicida TaxID=348837 RepID=V6LZ94_9EUKA|nr:Cysteine-rich membrane protein 1 [Spironucleus salmonicida]|eukprot:EST49603.1 Cysteine-rich membrane protein 1 [Spironucleus salmonicida]